MRKLALGTAGAAGLTTRPTRANSTSEPAPPVARISAASLMMVGRLAELTPQPTSSAPYWAAVEAMICVYESVAESARLIVLARDAALSTVVIALRVAKPGSCAPEARTPWMPMRAVAEAVADWHLASSVAPEGTCSG